MHIMCEKEKAHLFAQMGFEEALKALLDTHIMRLVS